MRCRCCDCLLTDFEATRKSAITEEYLDMCQHCLELGDADDFELIEREDLRTEIPIEDELGDLDE